MKIMQVQKKFVLIEIMITEIKIKEKMLIDFSFVVFLTLNKHQLKKLIMKKLKKLGLYS